ncbi:hypothetical protein BASA83_005181 [Batrachochytrium salamandrivorans]|nr:hypothetical protein BASA83_005181 [Batrachochytrium salamandrivorans]
MIVPCIKKASARVHTGVVVVMAARSVSNSIRSFSSLPFILPGARSTTLIHPQYLAAASQLTQHRTLLGFTSTGKNTTLCESTPTIPVADASMDSDTTVKSGVKTTPPAPLQINRFWKSASVGTCPAGFTVLLDTRVLKTPGGNPVVIPLSKPLLATLIAAEWEGQEERLKSYSLPLTSIIVRALDSFKDPAIRQGVIDGMLKYVHTDSVCYQQSYPDSLVKLQHDYWKPLIDWLKNAHHLDIATTDGIISVKQSQSVVDKLRSMIEKYDDIKLAAFEKAVMRSKSFIIGLALVEREISVDFGSTSRPYRSHTSD